eukprot:1161047-Pelagomonas_calceolata.AAC.45
MPESGCTCPKCQPLKVELLEQTCVSTMHHMCQRPAMCQSICGRCAPQVPAARDAAAGADMCEHWAALGRQHHADRPCNLRSTSRCVAHTFLPAAQLTSLGTLPPGAVSTMHADTTATTSAAGEPKDFNSPSDACTALPGQRG